MLGSVFDLCGIPSTGGTAWAAMLGMDKLAFSGVMQAAGLPCLPRLLVTDSLENPPFRAPYIVKPRMGGSSLGIQIAADMATVHELVRTYPPLRAGAIVEPFLSPASDLNVAFRTRPNLEYSLIERPMRNSEDGFYDYRAKYLEGGGLEAAPRELPANIPDTVRDALLNYTSTIVGHGAFAGVGRIDFLLHDESLYVNEINTIPGAMSFYLWPDDVQYRELLLGMVEEAKEKPGWPQGGDHAGTGEALRVASGISQKLMQQRGGAQVASRG